MTPLDALIIAVIVVMAVFAISIIVLVTAGAIFKMRERAYDSTPEFERSGRSFRVVWEPERR